MNYYNTDIQFKYELLEHKIFRLTLVLSQDMDEEPCKNYELKGELKMQKVFMTAKEVQDFLEDSRTTAYQLINEMNQELTKLGYRVQEPFIKLQSSLGIANNNINQIARRVNKTGVEISIV